MSLIAYINLANIEAIEQLIADGVDVNTPDEFGSIPLHEACQRYSKEIVELLIKANPDKINTANIIGVTPLHVAVQGIQRFAYPIVNLLLINGANPNVKDDQGYTPLQRAYFYHNYEIAKLLISFGAVRSKELDTSCFNKII